MINWKRGKKNWNGGNSWRPKFTNSWPDKCQKHNFKNWKGNRRGCSEDCERIIKWFETYKSNSQIRLKIILKIKKYYAEY